MAEHCLVKIFTPSPFWESSLSGLSPLVTAAVNASVIASKRVHDNSEVSVALSDDRELRILNAEYRGVDAPTNVLAFPGDELDTDEGSFTSLGRPLILGDVLVAYETVRAEAEADGKDLKDHLVHILVHGTLHLCGFDHERDNDAKAMEKIEASVLKGLGIANPYAPPPKSKPKSKPKAKPKTKAKTKAKSPAKRAKAKRKSK